MGYAVISGNQAKGFVVLKDTARHLRPFFSGDAVLRLTWPWMLLYCCERGNTTQQLLKREESLRELAVGGDEVDQHW
jgi:hypothetical protein